MLKITICPNFVISYMAEIKDCSTRPEEMLRTRGGKQKLRLETSVQEWAIFIVLNFRLLIWKHEIIHKNTAETLTNNWRTWLYPAYISGPTHILDLSITSLFIDLLKTFCLSNLPVHILSTLTTYVDIGVFSHSTLYTCVYSHWNTHPTCYTFQYHGANVRRSIA